MSEDVDLERLEFWGHKVSRISATVDGRRVYYRSGHGRGWQCHACGIRSGARCEHVRAVREAVARR